MESPFRFMSKGSWVIIGVILLYAVLLSLHTHQFLKGNVWYEDRLEGAGPRELETDMQEMHVTSFVSQSVGAVLAVLLIAFIYLAVRLQRLKQQIQQLVGRALPEEREDSRTVVEPSHP